MEANMKGSEVLLGQRVRVYHDRDMASRHRYAVVFMDRRFDRGQYEALLMDHRPLDPREGFCVWGQRREHYQRGKRMRCGELPKQCRLVLLKTLMKDESVRHWFLDRAQNLRSDEIAEHLFFGHPLSFERPLWLKSPDLYLLLDSGMLKALKEAEILVCGVLALSGSIRG
jgi:hypothetical protein